MNLCFKEELKMRKNKKAISNKKSNKVYFVPTEPVHKVPAKSSIGISVEKIKEMEKSSDTYYIV